MDPEELERALEAAVAGLPDAVPAYAGIAAAGHARRRARTIAASSALAVLLGAGVAVAGLDRGTPDHLVTAVDPPSPDPAPGSPTPTPTPSPTPSAGPTAAPSRPAPPAGPPSPSPSPAPSCLPVIEPYEEPPPGDSSAHPDRLLFAAAEGLSLVPTAEPPPWPAELVVANHREPGQSWDESGRTGQFVRSVARTASGRIFATVWLPCGKAVFGFDGHGPATKVLDIEITDEEWGDLLLSPDGRTLAVHSGWNYGPGWHDGHQIPPVVLVDVATGAVLRRVAVPEIVTEWLADGSGFLYVGKDDALHRFHLDGSEGPTTPPAVGCAWTTVGRGRGGQLVGAQHCAGTNSATIFAMAEDGTAGQEVHRFTPSNAVTALVPAPTGLTTVAVVVGTTYLVAPDQPALRLNGCAGRDGCDPVGQGRAYGLAW